ncbi:MAG TPA: cell division protein FtsH, partial [Rhodobacteraceae bacterium]|nr:cell division protein FtsH [Paracoccaceae bacterium]
MNNFRNFALWIIIGLLLVALFNLFQGPSQKNPGNDIPYSQMLSEVESGNVRDVTIVNQNITGHYTNGRTFKTYAPKDPGLVEKLNAKGVEIIAKPQEKSPLFSIFVSWFPM